METKQLVPEFGVTEAYTFLLKDNLLLDVRENEEIQELIFDLPHVLYIPLSELDKRYTEIPQDAEIIIACKGGNRGLSAADFLIQKGFEDLIILKGGLNKWVKKGLPVKGDTSSILGGGSCCDDISCFN